MRVSISHGNLAAAAYSGRTVLLSMALWATAACGDSPLGNSNPGGTFVLKSVTERVRSDPDLIQIGTFVYDTRDRLVRYEFRQKHFGSSRLTYYAEYEWEGTRLAETRTYAVRDGKSAIDIVRRYEHDAQGRIVASTAEIASTGAIVRVEYQYDAQGRLVARLIAGDSREAYEYDANGRLVRSLHYLEESGSAPVTEVLYTPGEGLNPFYGLPPGGPGIILISPAAGPLGRGLPRRVDLYTPSTGANPSYTTVEAELNAQGLPIRRTDTLVNTADPANQTTVVESEYEYRQR